MEIKNNTAEFSFSKIGSVTSESYMGKFKTKCVLSISEEIEADRDYRSLLGDNLLYAKQEIREFAFALSQLKHRVIESPYFWKDLNEGVDCLDKNIIFDLLNLAMEAQTEFLKKNSSDFNKKQEDLTNLLKSGEIVEDEEESDESGVSDV